MMFLVVLSLAALAAAVPVPYDLRQQIREIDDVDTLPYYYGQQYNPYGTDKNARYFPYHGQERELYPFLPYNYKNVMSYPYRSNYHLRDLNWRELGVEKPKVDYDSKDIYHMHDINHHHLVNNIHDVQQKQTLRKVGREMDSTYFRYSPLNQYTNMYHYYNRGYPYVNKFYGKSLDQEYIQPYNHYNRYWDMDYIRNYYSRNLDYVRPAISKYNVEYTKPVISENQYLKYVKPVITKSLDVEHTKPVVPMNLDLEYVKPVLTKSLDVEYIKPAVSKNLDLEYFKPILAQNTEQEYIRPVVSKNLNIVKPTISKSLEVEYQQPIDFEFVPDRSRRNLDDEYNYRKWSLSNLWDAEQGVEDIVSMNRFKRELETPAGTHVATAQIATPLNQETDNLGVVHQLAKELNPEIPVVTGNVEVGHQIAKGLNQEIPVVSGNVEVGHQIAKGLNQEIPVTSTVDVNRQTPIIVQPDVLVAEQTPQEGLRQDVQLNAHQNVQTIVHAEDHMTQQPIQREKRANFPYFYLYPYYIYVPIHPVTIA